jgi:hypothetical protein
MADVYAVTRTFDRVSGERVLSVKVNGGTLVVDCAHGAEWVTFRTFTEDTAEVVNFSNSRVYRFTPAGGATYAL